MSHAAEIHAACIAVVPATSDRRSGMDNPCSARELVRLQFVGYEREVFGVLFFDARHRLIEFEEMFRGALTQASVHPREAIRRAMHDDEQAFSVPRLVVPGFLLPCSGA